MTAVVRTLLVVAGLGMAAYGISLIWDMTTSDVWSIVVWLAGGLLIHDAIIAPLYTVAGKLGARVFPSTVWAPVLVASTATLITIVIAIPVISPRPADETPTNPTLLDRHYVLGLVLALVIIWILAAIVAVRNHRSRNRAIALD